MAHVKKNIVTEGLSGKLGNTLVFRSHKNKTIVSVRPEKTNRPRSEAQQRQQRRFQQGIAYAKKATQDTALKASYALRAKAGQTAYNVALADYLNAPEIQQVDASLYTGTKGSPVLIQVVDDHSVAEVKVSVYDPQGVLLEEGKATLEENGWDWVYTTQKPNAQRSGSKIFVTASDLPGNHVIKETVIA